VASDRLEAQDSPGHIARGDCPDSTWSSATCVRQYCIALQRHPTSGADLSYVVAEPEIGEPDV
jgi:hypothetical protein